MWPFAAVAGMLTLGQVTPETSALGDALIAPGPDLVAHAAAEFRFDPQAVAGETPTHRVGESLAQPLDQPSLALGMFDEPASQPEATPASTAPAARKNEFFHQGSWRWQPTLSIASDFSDVSLVMGGVAFSYFIERNLTIDFELNGLYIDQQGEASSTGAANASMLFRWHCWMDERDPDHPRWSVYFDAGAGLLYAGSDVPFEGSEFNFTPQAGIGASFLLDEASDARLMTGVRWFHISNANIFDSNEGVDSLMLYAGVNFGF